LHGREKVYGTGPGRRADCGPAGYYPAGPNRWRTAAGDPWSRGPV